MGKSYKSVSSSSSISRNKPFKNSVRRAHHTIRTHNRNNDIDETNYKSGSNYKKKLVSEKNESYNGKQSNLNFNIFDKYGTNYDYFDGEKWNKNHSCDFIEQMNKQIQREREENKGIAEGSNKNLQMLKATKKQYQRRGKAKVFKGYDRNSTRYLGMVSDFDDDDSKNNEIHKDISHDNYCFEETETCHSNKTPKKSNNEYEYDDYCDVWYNNGRHIYETINGVYTYKHETVDGKTNVYYHHPRKPYEWVLVDTYNTKKNI